MSLSLALLLAGVEAVAATCTVGNTTLAFGAYNPVSGSPTFANATITVSCSQLLSVGQSDTVNYAILLSGGGSGSTANRAMSGPSSLPYNLYTSASYSTIWDNSTGVSGSLVLIGLLNLPVLVSGSDSKTVYGRIPVLQPASAGAYSDSLTITVNY